MAFFDGAPLQILQEEEEEGEDQADISRENELKKLLTDLPDDMLEDSREASFVEQETSTCNNKNAENSPQSKWIQQWSDHPRPTSHEQNYEAGYNQLPYGFDDNNVLGNNSHPHHAPIWNQQSKEPHFVQEDYTQTSIATEKSTEDSLFATDLTYEPDPHPQRVYNQVTCDRDGLSGNIHDNGDRHDPRMHFQAGATEQGVYPNTASYNPAHQKLNPQVQHQVGPFDQLQRELLDSTQQTAEKEQLAQLQILKKAQDKQIEGLEQKLEELRRSMRYLEHQHAIVKDERDGFAVKLNESSRLLDNAKDREAQMQNKLRVVEQDIQVLNRKDQENTEKQRVAEAAIDSMKLQMLCRSDTLSKASEKHDRDVAAIKEKHEAAVLTLQQKLDLLSKAMNEQVGSNHQLRDQVKQLERQREDEQLERARIVNALTQQLEESQQQSAKLLQNSPVHALSEIQIKLQQAHAAKVQSEEINIVLQEDLANMKEQITLYESAFKHGVIPLELTDDSENQLSDSCLALGLKKIKQKNGTLHSIATANFSDSNLPKYETMREEMQRCLAVLQAKGQKISQLQEELQQSRVRVEELQTQLHEAKLRSVRESSQIKPTNLAEKDQNDLVQLKEDKQRLQDQVEALQKKTIELKQSEEKVKSAYSELCVKMKQMIQELDKEKQETAERLFASVPRCPRQDASCIEHNVTLASRCCSKFQLYCKFLTCTRHTNRNSGGP